MAGSLGNLVVAGGGESSDSEEDYWDIGYMDRPPQTVKGSLATEERDETFKKALTSGDVSLVEELLNSGMSVESSFQFGWTPLMCAVNIANVELVRILLDRGANASFDKDQYTILMAACAAHASESQILKTVELLLSRNANPNVACRKCMTPVMYAAREGHAQVVALLVAHGAEINAQDENGYTALTWAARQGHKSVVLKLLELGANKTIQTKDGKTAGEIAKRNKHPELFTLLSLTVNPLQGKLQHLTKEEAICRLLTTDGDAGKEHKFSSYTAFGDVEVFLRGLGLEHMTELLKERDITLRQLLTMRKEDFTENGITSIRDQQKILDAVKELQVEEIKFGELTEVTNLEISQLSSGGELSAASTETLKFFNSYHYNKYSMLQGIKSFQNVELLHETSESWNSSDEFLNFLLKLNKQCGHLTTAVQNIINQLPVNSHKIVLEWGSSQRFTSVCENLVCNVEDLGEEVCKLKDLIQKLQNDQKNDPCRVLPMETYSTWSSRFLKRATFTVCGFGFLLFIFKLTFRKS